MADAALKSYFYARYGININEQFGGKWNWAAGHLDTHVMVHASVADKNRPERTMLAFPGGWYDAGDYGKYILNSSITTWTLLQSLALNTEFHKNQNLNIPESGNDLPDVLDEALVNLKWMITMQNPTDGGVYHKLNTKKFDAFIMPAEAEKQRNVVQKSTSAALDFVSTMSAASRILQKNNPLFSHILKRGIDVLLFFGFYFNYYFRCMTTTKYLFISILFISFVFDSFAQDIQYFEAPENLQLYARDMSDSASVLIRGKIPKGIKYDELTLKVFKDNELYTSQDSKIEDKQFRADARIDAGLHQFRFELQFKKGKKVDALILADSVVCGDAYIVTGQSNSHASSSLCAFSSPYCRSFGVKTGYEAYSENDQKVRWGLASGNCPGLKGVGGWFKKNPHGVGVWGMELARLIVEKHKVPVCVINGGSGSSSIEQNMLYPEIPSLETSFGRLSYRVNQAGLKDKIKVIFWHQGESNSNENYLTYAKSFDVLYQDWKRVYTGLEKIYLFQLHPGCGGNFQSELREIQHQNANRYDDVEIMSTTGVVGHDGCHFLTEGYYEFAQRIFPLVSRDFYGEKTDEIITPPTLLKAFYQTEKEIVLKFDQPIALREKHTIKGKAFLMKDQFFFRIKNSDEVIANVVESLEVSHEKITLKLNNELVYDNISWLPNKNYLGTEICYNGPWIRGKENNIGALSFDRKTVEKSSAKQEAVKSEWHGFAMLDSTFNGVPFKIVKPKETNINRNWIWRARFWGHEPQTDIALLKQGFHLVYIEVGGLFGNPKALGIWNDFYAFATENYQLNKKVVLEGMSRGGLIIFNWGNANAKKVACIYGDAPVCDFKSWPGGKGTGKGSKPDWKKCKEEYGFTEKIALEFNGNPINHMENIARLKVPILNVVGDADKVVPVSENTALLEKRLKDLGWEMEVIHKPEVGHHPHSLKDPKSIVDFILKSTGNQ